MSWNQLQPEIQNTALDVLTPAQLSTWKLELAGLSTRAIALHQDLARSTINDRLTAAHRNLRNAGIHQDHHGNWTHEETAAA